METRVKTNRSKLVVGMLIIAALANQASAGLIAEYKCSGNIIDTSGNNNNGTVYGATLTQDRFGNADSAYAFDGDDYIQTPVNSNRIDLSYSVWFNPAEVEGERSIVDSDSFSRYGHSLIIGYWDGNGELDVQYHNGNINSGIYMRANEWYHAAVVYSDTIQLWLNGLLVSEQAYTPPSFDGTDFRLGRHNPRDSQWFNGAIDDIRFYDHALSENEILSLYNQVPEPATLALLGLGGLILRKRK